MIVIYTILDFETTGLNPEVEQIIEIGALKVDADINIVGQFTTKVALRDGMELSDFIMRLTGITPESLAHGLDEKRALVALNNFIADDIIIAQFASFDLGFLQSPKDFICTKTMYNLLYPERDSGLSDIVQHYGIEYKNHHQAMSDVLMTTEVFKVLKAEAEEKGIRYVNVLTERSERPLPYIPAKATVIKL